MGDIDYRKAYKEILNVMEKHSSAIVGDSVLDISDRLKMLIGWEDVFDDFGFSINRSRLYGNDYVEISTYQYLAFYSKDNRRQISWSDDGRQPDGEWLYSVQFPTGGYIFSKDYPTKTFNAFFDELRSFKPKYSDTANHCLYFDSSNALSVYKKIGSLFDKYREKVADEVKQMKINELENEIEALRAEQ